MKGIPNATKRWQRIVAAVAIGISIGATASVLQGEKAYAATYTITYDVPEESPSVYYTGERTQTKQTGETVTISQTKPSLATAMSMNLVRILSNGGTFSDGSTEMLDTVGHSGNHEFLYWKGSDGVDYAPGATYSKDADLMLTPEWDSEQIYAIELPVATRDGYRLVGYYTEETGGDLVGTAGESYIGNARTLYAHWAEGTASDDSPEDEPEESSDGNSPGSETAPETTPTSDPEEKGDQEAGNRTQDEKKELARNTKSDIVQTGESHGAILIMALLAVSFASLAMYRIMGNQSER